MTPAAYHATTLIELVVLPAFWREGINIGVNEDGSFDDDVTSITYDFIANVLHWCEDQGGDPYRAHDSGWAHYAAESDGTADDMAYDTSLTDRANELRARHGLPTQEVT